MSLSCCFIMVVSRPLRRCVGLTLTQVTPAVGSEPPGTVMSNEKMPVVLTISSPSKLASVRSYSQSAFVFAVSSGGATGAPKPMNVAVTKVSNSSGITGRISMLMAPPPWMGEKQCTTPAQHRRALLSSSSANQRGD